MEKRPVLVTGGTGFAGSHLVEELVRNGQQVTCLVRKTSDRRYLANLGVTFVEAALLDNRENLARIVSGQRVVYHVAGAVRALSYDEFVRTNAQATEELLEACVAAKEPPQRFVLVSSVGATGPGPGGIAVTHTQEAHPVTDYGRSKLEGERRARAFTDRIKLVVVRPSAIYGPRDRETLPIFRSAKSGIMPTVAGPQQMQNFCFVEDVAHGIALAGEADVESGDTFVLGAPRDYTMREFCEILCAQFGRKAHLVPVPRPLLYGIALANEALAGIMRRPAMLNRQKVPEVTAFWRMDNSHAREKLGYEPRWDLPEGVARTATWYREAGLL